MSRKRPIYLIGMMGVGKSTVGAELATRLGRTFVDTDEEVERAAGQSVAEIFETEGEAHFRALEFDAIESATTEAAVVALGGGAAAEPGVMQRLLASGETIYLKADPELLIGRIPDAASRPLLAGLDRGAQIEKLETLLEKRRPFYGQARIQIEARGTTDEVVHRIIEALTT